MSKPALAIIEFKSIARGISTTDVIAKKAPVKILTTNPTCPGKYAVIFAGEVGDVEESFKAGLIAGGDLIIHDLFLPYVHPDIIPAIAGATNAKEIKSLGIIESFSVASCIAAADKAAKISPAQLLSIRLANGLGGKGYFTMTGELADIEASIGIAQDHLRKEGLLVAWEIIASPHPDLLEKGVYW